MRFLAGLVAVGALIAQAAAQKRKLKDQYPWYRTGDQIYGELQDLAIKCDGVDFQLSTLPNTLKTKDGKDVQLDVVHVNKGSSDGKKKAMLVFGEHARELISPESGLALLRTLCDRGNDGISRDLVDRVLASTSFVIVPNANPIGRKEVEAGEYCKRTDENGVDLNRNWGDAHRDNNNANKDDESNPGPHGFSEAEDVGIRDLALSETPDIYLSVHSGAYLLGTPFGYTANRTADGEQQMLAALKPISEKFCDGGCPYGDLAGMIGYESKGCDIDYIKETLNTPYVYTWEIYTGKNLRGFYEEEAHARAEKRPLSEDAKDFFWAKSISLAQRGRTVRRSTLRGRAGLIQPEAEEDTDDCFRQFNPETEDEATSTATRWAEAFLTLADEVAGGAGNAGAATPATPEAAPAPTAPVPQVAPAAPPPPVAPAASAGTTAAEGAAMASSTHLASMLDNLRHLQGNTWLGEHAANSDAAIDSLFSGSAI